MDVQKDKIDEILLKWLMQTATEEELDILKKWGRLNEENLKLIENLGKTWKEDTPEPLFTHVESKANEIWAAAMQEQPKKPMSWRKVFRYAAAILIFSISFFWVLNLADRGKTEKEDSTALASTFILRENLPGQKTKVLLPDGTVVFLNSSSSIKYQENFEGRERRVVLNGEAFFEVAKDANKPFIVECLGIETEALGTAFNVNAFDPHQIGISLIEGKVRINESETNSKLATLSPGNQLLINLATRKFFEQAFDSEEVIGWTVGKLVFSHADFQAITSGLEKWFGVDITVKGNAPEDWQISTVYQNQTLKNILTDLQYSKKFAYEINGTNVTITF